MIGLTDRQQEIYDFLIDFFNDHKWMPTLREIADEFGFSGTKGAYDHLRAIEKKGYITINKYDARAIRITNKEYGIPA